MRKGRLLSRWGDNIFRVFVLPLVRNFEPFMFVMVMAFGITSALLYEYPYPGRWLKICSYITFAICALLFVAFQLMAVVHCIVYSRERGFGVYFDIYFRGLNHNATWGMYPIALFTMVNYMSSLANEEALGTKSERPLMVFSYALWWYGLLCSLFTAWMIPWLTWQRYYFPGGIKQDENPREKMVSSQLKTALVLPIVPLVVASSSSGDWIVSAAFENTFNRNTQLITFVVTLLSWFHAMPLVAVIVTIFIWNLYVNKLPAMGQVFSLFLIIGPLGQGSFGILRIAKDFQIYVDTYYSPNYPTNVESLQRKALLIYMLPWMARIISFVLGIMLIALGFYFTFIAFVSIASYIKTTEASPNGNETELRLYHFHKGWFSMTFPMGTMALGTGELYAQYNDYMPLSAFRVISAIYAALCIIWTLACTLGTLYFSVLPAIQENMSHSASKSSHKDLDVSDKTLVTQSSGSLMTTENLSQDSLRNIDTTEGAMDFTRLA